MTIFAGLAGAISSFWFIVIGLLLRVIIRSDSGHQLFHGAYLIGDICFWIAGSIIALCMLFGLLADVIFVRRGF